MRRLLTVAVAAGVLFALSASTASADASPERKPPETSCGVGFRVAFTTQQLDGLGRAIKEFKIEETAGEAIQAFHEEVKETCK
jgi:hypothetical protein